MTDIRYRRFEKKDKESLLALFEAAFGKKKDLRRWEWEFLDGPSPGLVVIAESDGGIVGHYAVIPRDFKVKDSFIRGGLVVDVMTHPDYGRRGIFAQCGVEAFRYAEQGGLSMLVGFPNEAAIRGHLKLKWIELGTLRVRARPLKVSGLLKAIGRTRNVPVVFESVANIVISVINGIMLGEKTSGLSVEWYSSERLEAVLPDIENLAIKSMKSFVVCNARSRDWISWRLSDPDGKTLVLVLRDPGHGEMVGFCAMRIETKDEIKICAIMDVVAKEWNPRILGILIREGLRRAIHENSELVIMLDSPRLSHQIPLFGIWMPPTPKKLRFIVRQIGDQKLPDEVYELGNWHLELIDHDVF